jgi:CRP-like cAMP-binding protein
VFGELAIMDDAPRSVTARVAEDSILWCIEKSNFDLLCRDHPSTALRFTQNLMRLFCKRIRDNHQDYREMILVGAGRKTA